MAQILTIDPDLKSKRIRKAQEFYNANELDDAVEIIQDILAEQPSDAQALVLMAGCLKRANKTPIAYSLAKRATEVKPDRAEVWQALGHCAQALWKLDEALTCYDKALSLAESDKHKALYLTDISSIHLDRGKFERAEPFLRKAMMSDRAWNTRHNLGLSLLGQKKWSEGWPCYSASIGTESRTRWKYRKGNDEEPVWDGTKGQTVVVHGEQGLGDEICFASMLPDAAKDCRIIVDCDKRLKTLFARSFPQCSVYGTRWEKLLDWDESDRTFDASCSSAELGHFYRNADADFPRSPYLKADHDRSLMWRALFAEKKKPVIGIAWSGGTYQNGEAYRFAELENWLPLFESIDAHYVSLQYKQVGQSVLAFKAKNHGIDLAEYPYATLTSDYDDTAALVSALDCVVSVPTTVVHLAGALGVPTVMMKFRYQCWKTAAGVPFHPLTALIDWQGSWKESIEATIPHVSEICSAKYSSATTRASR
jgi:tetratricopeptide (TPR) repeat protein